MANFGTTEVLIILAVVLVLFGSAKLPQLARSLGKSARILKTETKGLYDDDTPHHQGGHHQGGHHQGGHHQGNAAAPEPAPHQQQRSPAPRPHPQGPGQNALPSGQRVQEVPLPEPHSHRT